MTSTEHVLSTTPFVVRRRVKWGECDPAGVVYTVTFAEYVISAAELFYGFLFDGTPQRIKDEYRFGTPSRALAFDFRRSLRPDEEFDMTVSVTTINSRTYTLEIVARTPGGDDVFVAQLTPICVVRGERKAIEIPPPFRSRLEQYQNESLDHGR
jgi:acyl-CoA thioester hydrolase